MQQEVSFAELKARFLSLPEVERLQLLLDHQHLMRQVGDPLIEVAVVQRAQQLGMRRAAVLTPSSAAKKAHRFMQKQQESDPLAELDEIAKQARKRRAAEAPCKVVEPPPAAAPEPAAAPPADLQQRMARAFDRLMQEAA